MSAKGEKAMQYYRLGLWSEKTLKIAVDKGWITEEEYQSIVVPVTESEGDDA